MQLSPQGIPSHSGTPMRQCLLCLLILSLGLAETTFGQTDYEQAPIRYSESQPQDPVTELQQSLDSGKVVFEYDERQGYLRSLLKAFEISPTSQLLVYSKTSLQLHRISPRTPRSIYFNDDVYIGFIPGSDRLEISSADPKLGGVFYVLKQDKDLKPVFARDQGNCLSCHATSRTQGVPGHLLRSVYTSPNGQPHYGMGTHLTTQASPFIERYGGWFATGKHGKIRHLANQIVEEANDKVDPDGGANIVDLSDRFRTSRYLTPHSDWISLMVLTHQAEMHNLITLVSYQTRQALYQGQVMNKALERPADFVSESTRNRIFRSVEKMLKYMLFTDEVALESPIVGTSGYRKHFESLGPFDGKGRSLRQFDLQTRTFKYRCSYLIYSKSFSQLPEIAKQRAYSRLWEILNGKDQSGDYRSIPESERNAIREILVATVKDLPDYWK